MSLFGNILKGIGKGASAVGKTVLKGVSIISGGSGAPGGMGQPTIFAPGTSLQLPGSTIGSGGFVPTGASISSPVEKQGGLLGLFQDVSGLIQTATGIGKSVNETVNKTGGLLDVVSGNKPIQIEASTSTIPNWLFPLLGGLLALLLIRPLLKGGR